MWQNLTEFERGMLAALQCPEPAAPVRVEKGGEAIELRRTPEGWQLRLAQEAMLAPILTTVPIPWDLRPERSSFRSPSNASSS